jgi:hypothetical protein
MRSRSQPRPHPPTGGCENGRASRHRIGSTRPRVGRREASSVLRRLREERGMTLEALAFKSSVSLGALGRIETHARAQHGPPSAK